MKRYMTICLLLLPFWVAAQTVYTVEMVPNTRLESNAIHVSDPDNILDPEYESLINEALCGIQEQADVFVVCLNSIEAASVESFSADLFNTWGIGDAKLNNGLLMLLVTDIHKFRFEVGYGIEEVMTDYVCRDITENTVIPYFKKNLYPEGIYAGVCDVVDVFGGVMPSDSTLTDVQRSNLSSVYSRSENEYEYDDRGVSQIIWEDFLHDGEGHINPLSWIYVLISIGLVVIMVVVWAKLFKKKNSTQEEVDKTNKEIKDSLGVTGCLGCFFPALWLVMPLFLVARPILRRQQKKCVCGHAMHRLSEKEEDAYLNEKQCFEEDIKVRDYDVWLCDKCGRTAIYYYDLGNAKRYEICPHCKYKAGKKIKTETLVSATYDHGGTIQKTYLCKHCKHEFKKRESTPKLTHSSSSSSSGGGSWGGGHSGGSFGGGHSGGGGYTGSW